MSNTTKMFCYFAVGVLGFVFGLIVSPLVLSAAMASNPVRCGGLWVGDGVMTRMDATNFKEVCYKFHNPPENGPIRCIRY